MPFMKMRNSSLIEHVSLSGGRQVLTQKIKNTITIEVDSGVDFTTSSNIEFYLKQGSFFKAYTGDGGQISVVSAKQITVTIPKADADKLTDKFPAELQFALTDANGMPISSNVLSVKVNELLKEIGYGS